MNWLRKLIQGPANSGAADSGETQRVFSRVQPEQALDSARLLIAELADGRTLSELLEAIYQRETSAAGPEASLWIWRDALDRRSRRLVRSMADAGLLELQAAGTPAACAPESPSPEPGQRRCLPPEQTAVTAS